MKKIFLALLAGCFAGSAFAIERLECTITADDLNYSEFADFNSEKYAEIKIPIGTGMKFVATASKLEDGTNRVYASLRHMKSGFLSSAESTGNTANLASVHGSLQITPRGRIEATALAFYNCAIIP